MKGARRARLHCISLKLVTPDHWLRSVASLSDSPRHTHSRITIGGLRRPTLSTRRGQTLGGNPGRHAVCGPAVVKSAPLFPPRPPRAAAPLLPHPLDRRRLGLVAPLSHPIYKNINRAIIYAPGSSHAYIQQIIKISQHMSQIRAYKL
jgi:hypothetical protein